MCGSLRNGTKIKIKVFIPTCNIHFFLNSQQAARHSSADVSARRMIQAIIP